MKSKNIFSIGENKELLNAKDLLKNDDANILNFSNYSKEFNKNYSKQDIEDSKNKNGLPISQNYNINLSPNKDNFENQNLKINILNKGNLNYLNEYNIIINQNYNIYNDNQNKNQKINIIKNNQINDNSETKFNLKKKKKFNDKENFFLYIKKGYMNNKELKRIILNIEIILTLLSNYKGSIFLQNILSNMSLNEISLLFVTIYPYMCSIMCLEFGNYFIQKLIKYLNVQQRLDIYQIIDNNFLDIATNKSGTHSIQALFGAIINPIEQFYFNKLLNKNMLLLFNNEYGYHIIMKVILEVNENQRNNINLFFISNVEKIVTNPFGAYCGTKFVLYNSNLDLRKLLINNIRNNIKNLIFNKSSCSFIMLAIMKFGVENFQFIIDEIKNNLAFLSLHFVSNLFISRLLNYLKFIEYTDINSILWSIYRNDNLIKGLCSSKNGKQLLKKLMEYSNGTQKKYIKTKLKLIKRNNCK